MLERSITGLLKQLGVAALYASLVYIGESHFESSSAVVGYFEPASGLALAALLIGGRRYVWSIFLGAFLIHATTDDSLWEAVAIASGDTLQTFCGAWLLSRDGKFDLRLQSLRDYLRLILLGGGASIAIGALTVNTTLLVFGLLDQANYFHSLVQWWMSDTLGVILIAPLILAWLEIRKDWRTARMMAEAALLLGLTILAGQAVFLDWWHDSIGQIAKGYWMFLITTWVAVRIGLCGTTVVLTMTATYALLGAIHGVGFFADDIAKTHLVNYWLFMTTLSVVGMALATHFTERKKAELALRQYKMVIDTVNDGFCITDAMGNMLEANAAYARMSGYSVDELLKMRISQLEAKERSVEDVGAHIEKIAARGHERFETRHRHKDGHEIDVEVSATFMPELQQFFVFVHDITGRKQAEEQIRNLAFYDALTQLPNRRLLNNRLEQMIAASKRSGRYCALMFLDLDNFKPLNDAYGHDVGDLLLIEVAQRLTRCVREVDTVARFGGDEFVVMLVELDADKTESATQAGIVAEKIRTALSKPYLLKIQQEGKAETTVEHHCAASIGVVVFNGKVCAEYVIKWADIAMYQAKEGGRNQVHFFDSES